jgi:hypothetical protein
VVLWEAHQKQSKEAKDKNTLELESAAKLSRVVHVCNLPSQVNGADLADPALLEAAQSLAHTYPGLKSDTAPATD